MDDGRKHKLVDANDAEIRATKRRPRCSEGRPCDEQEARAEQADDDAHFDRPEASLHAEAKHHRRLTFEYKPEHLRPLLNIIVDENTHMAVRLAASVHFKNIVGKNWLLAYSDEQIVPASTRTMIRECTLDCFTQLHPLLRAQLGEAIKIFIDVDYPKQWDNLLQWLKLNLESQDRKFGALFVLRTLSRKYQFKSSEERIPLYLVEDCIPCLLQTFRNLVQLSAPIEVADSIKLICKIFWSLIYLEVPKLLLDPGAFNAWTILFLKLYERSCTMESLPVDPDDIKSWGWWKVDKWIIRILNHLCMWVCDRKLGGKAFAEIFRNNYAEKILGCHLNFLNSIRAIGCLPNTVVCLILQYLADSITKNSTYQLMQPQIDTILFEIIYPLVCFHDSDQLLWDEDPHEYVRRCYDSTEDMYNPRKAAVEFVGELVRRRGKDNLQKVIHFIFDIFWRYGEAPIEMKPHRQKDGALLAIGTVCDKLKQIDPYRASLEQMLVQHVFPEFNSHFGHLRAKAAWVAGQFADIKFSDQDNFLKAMHYVISGLHDPELPVQVDSAFALRYFVEACEDLSEIRRMLPQLLDELIKLMNEVENEDLVFILELLILKFAEEMAPYALLLCQHLATTFWRCTPSREAGDVTEETSTSADVSCLSSINTILLSISSCPHLFRQIEPIMLPILRMVLIPDYRGVFMKGMEMISYITFYSPDISLDVWSLWPLMMDVNDWAKDFFEDIRVPLQNYISRGTDHFVACNDPDHQQSLWRVLSYIMSNENVEDYAIVPAAKLIKVLFRNCKGQISHWVEPYLRLTVARLHRAEKSYLKCLLVQVIANVLYENPLLTLTTLYEFGVIVEFFRLWRKTKLKSERDKKVCALGLTSLVGLPTIDITEALEPISRAIVELLAYKDQATAVDSESFDAGEEDEPDNGTSFVYEDLDEDNSL